ncbi:hypothetical protein CBR_g4598 [Chara braunii]|uniref:Protein CHUP1, chloroplastic n=1 Tax=Chara braunii TaxID=69332 RepID=A0A388KIB6_CHABU|nr:hypothetical protein CBR_g4598 [Chara braunii]|eukprot:GBG69767.1 hypothetical protein CBR_g4598 [Chara braunii]
MWVRFALIAASAVAWHVGRNRPREAVGGPPSTNCKRTGRTDGSGEKPRDGTAAVPRETGEKAADGAAAVPPEAHGEAAEAEALVSDLNDIVDLFFDKIITGQGEVERGNFQKRGGDALADGDEQKSITAAPAKGKEHTNAAVSAFLPGWDSEEDSEEDLERTLLFLVDGDHHGDGAMAQAATPRATAAAAKSTEKGKDESSSSARDTYAQLAMMLRSWREREKECVQRHEDMCLMLCGLQREAAIKASNNLDKAQRLSKGVEEKEMRVQTYMEMLREIREEEDTLKNIVSEFGKMESELVAEMEERRSRKEEMEAKLERFRKAVTIREEKKKAEVDGLVRKLLELDSKEREKERAGEKQTHQARYSVSVLNQQAEAERKHEAELENRVKLLGDLERQMEQMSARSAELTSACRQMVEVLARLVSECEKLATTPESQVLSRLEEEIHVQEELNRELKGKVDELQDTHFSDMGEIVYLRWMNACLRFELQDYEPPAGKVSAATLSRSRSPRSWEIARATLLEYAGPQFVRRRAREVAERRKNSPNSSLMPGTPEREEPHRDRLGNVKQKSRRKFIGRLRLWGSGGREGAKGSSEVVASGHSSSSPTHHAIYGGSMSPGVSEADGAADGEALGDLYSPVSSSGSLTTPASGRSDELSINSREISFVAAYKALSKAMAGSDVDKKYPPFNRAQQMANMWGTPVSTISGEDDDRITEGGDDESKEMEIESEPDMQPLTFEERERESYPQPVKIGTKSSAIVPRPDGIRAMESSPNSVERKGVTTWKPMREKRRPTTRMSVKGRPQTEGTEAGGQDLAVNSGRKPIGNEAKEGAEPRTKKPLRIATAPPKPSVRQPPTPQPNGIRASSGSGVPLPPPGPTSGPGGIPMPPPLAPPPPPGALLGFGLKMAGGGIGPATTDLQALRRTPQVIELYQTLMKRDTKKEGLALAAGVETAAIERRGEMIIELERRSSHVKAVMTDVEVQRDFINDLAREIRSCAFSVIEDVVEFVKWMDEELSFLVDERAVLKHFDNWPEIKADALREAAFDFKGLADLETEVLSLDENEPSLSSEDLWRKMLKLLDRMETCVYALLRKRETTLPRFVELQIPTSWMQDSGMIRNLKRAASKVARVYLRRVNGEISVLEKPVDDYYDDPREALLLQGIRFAFRAHQFAGGFDAATMEVFRELSGFVETIMQESSAAKS